MINDVVVRIKQEKKINTRQVYYNIDKMHYASEMISYNT